MNCSLDIFSKSKLNIGQNFAKNRSWPQNCFPKTLMLNGGYEEKRFYFDLYFNLGYFLKKMYVPQKEHKPLFEYHCSRMSLHIHFQYNQPDTDWPCTQFALKLLFQLLLSNTSKSH